jgi:hypothetical protein
MGTYEIGGRKRTFRCNWQISRQKWINLKSINIRSIIIIKQIQNMNLYKQDISKDTLQMQKRVKKPTFLRKHVSLSCLHFSLMFSEGEVKSPYFLQVWWALHPPFFLGNWLSPFTPPYQITLPKAMWAFAITWRLSSVNFSHFNLLLWNPSVKWSETW